MISSGNEPEQEDEKPGRKRAVLDELRSKLPHPYITGQGLKEKAEDSAAEDSETTSEDSDTAEAPSPPDSERPTD